MRTRTLLAAALALPLLGLPAGTATAAPEPGSPEYVQRDVQNIADAYARTQAQLANPAYQPALLQKMALGTVAQLMLQAASPTRPALTPGALVPGWDAGNPLRDTWAGERGQAVEVAFTNRYGALLRGTVWAPLPGATDPYTGARLRPPYPAVVVTPGSVQGSEGMYHWLGQDLAERGYVVLTYDVQGQGTSETLPHTTGDELPFCDVLGPTVEGEMTACPGVPSQQEANFVVGTRDATTFLLSTPSSPVADRGAAAADLVNPLWRLVDRRPLATPTAPGRTTKLAIIGHSLGGSAVSKVQARDRRVATVVGLDKLQSDGTVPVVPALAVQSEYGFSVAPYVLAGENSLRPTPSPDGPAPGRERASGWDAWDAAGVESMLVVPRASTHLEYTDIPLVLPASRWGQALTSVYVQRWLDRWLKGRSARPLLAERFRYLEPVGGGEWEPVVLERDPLLSFYTCSAVRLRVERPGDAGAGAGAGRLVRDGDLVDVGC